MSEPTVVTRTPNRRRSYLAVRMLCEGGIMLALALVLNAFKLIQFPNGGSVDLAMIPIFFFAIRWGVGPGLLVGFVFGLLQMFIDGAIAWGWQSLLLDYLVAFTPLGFAGLFRFRKNGIFFGTVLGAFLRFIVHYVSGITIYAITVPTELFSVTYTSPWMYSLVYNGSYMLVDMVICLVIFGLLYSPLKKYFLAEDIRPRKS